MFWQLPDKISKCYSRWCLFLYTSLIDGEFQCVTGLFENVNTPASRSWFRLTGLYVFPTIEFKCNGSIQGVRGIAYFAEQSSYRYNRTLVLNLNLWRRNQSHYVQANINRNVVLSPESVASGRHITGSFYFDMSGYYTFSINLADSSIEVLAGDILGIYLPPVTTYNFSTVINHIPIGAANNFSIPYFVTEPSACWSPTLGRTLCNSLRSNPIGAPMLSLNFVPTSNPTGKLALHVFDRFCVCDACIYVHVCFSMKVVLYQIVLLLSI